MSAVADIFQPKPSAGQLINSIAYDEDATRSLALEHCNRTFESLNPENRVEWAFENLPGNHVLSSSFGAQAAVSLHLITRVNPGIPVILIDTGYLFPETYRFVDELTERLRLNLQVYRADLSPAWQEARYGQRWKLGVEGLNAYNEQNKVEPMRRALRELQANTWFAGLRRRQSESRAGIQYLAWAGGRWKVHPIADWNDRDVYLYLKKHGLPYHPLWEKGYLSIGDQHSTRPIHEVSTLEQTRFFGLQRECGIHEIDLADL
jgi:phosphoadenosine phosphosulfate reductase